MVIRGMFFYCYTNNIKYDNDNHVVRKVLPAASEKECHVQTYLPSGPQLVSTVTTSATVALCVSTFFNVSVSFHLNVGAWVSSFNISQPFSSNRKTNWMLFLLVSKLP